MKGVDMDTMDTRSRGRSKANGPDDASSSVIDAGRTPRVPTRVRLSPGKAYNVHIRAVHDKETGVRLKGHKMVGYLDVPLSLASLRIQIGDIGHQSHAIVRCSSWIKATTFIRAPGAATGMLIIWTCDKGMCYSDVPPWKVGMLHGFETIDEAREYTSSELIDALKRSLR